MLASLRGTSPSELRLYTHSNFIYWWPVWSVGFILGILTIVWGHPLELAEGEPFKVLPVSGPGLLYACLILLTGFVTSVRLQGMRSIMLVMALIIILLFLAWSGYLDDLARLLPAIRTHLSAGFYFTLSGGLFILWLLQFLVFDRLNYWRIAEGQLTHVELAGIGEKSYDARGLTVEHEADDIFRHFLFGLGSGDLILRTHGADHEEIRLPNLLRVHRKINKIQELVAVEPINIHNVSDGEAAKEPNT